MLHLIMASHPEEVEEGPSGVPADEMMRLLGLDTSDSEKEEVLGDSDEDDLCIDTLDRFERQRAFQTQLLEQSGGGALDDSEGTFDFELERFVDRQSSRMGVRERHFKTRLRQRGNFVRTKTLSEPCKTDYVER